MTDFEAARAMREHPDSLDKRDLVLAANAGSWAQVSKEIFLERAAFAERALALDANYVPALSTDATVRAYLVLGGHSSDPASDLARAAREADRALMLAPDRFWVLVAKAAVLRAQGNLAAAAALIHRNDRASTSWGARYKDLGRVFLPLGLVREALENFRIAKQLALGIEPVQVDGDKRARRGVCAWVSTDPPGFTSRWQSAGLGAKEFTPQPKVTVLTQFAPEPARGS